MWGEGGGCIVLNIIKEINNCGDLRGSGNECEGPYTLSTFHITSAKDKTTLTIPVCLDVSKSP